MIKTVNYSYQLFTILIVIILVSSCRFATSINNTADIKEGKRFLKEYYRTIQLQDTAAINQLAAGRLKKTLGAAGLSRKFHDIYANTGRYKSHQILKATSKRFVGIMPGTEYKFIVNVVYTKGSVNESLTFIKAANAKELKLLSSNIIYY
jgi:hypothetical protein